MYERSAIILEKYFAEKFYYNEKNNIKANYSNYCDLIENLEKYQEISTEEDKIIKTCEEAASQIKKIQKQQSTLYRKAVKLQEDRNTLFENIDETAEHIERTLNKIEIEIDKNSEEMKPIDLEFSNVIREFNEKSEIRSKCGKDRRKVEKKYRDILENTTNNYNNIEKEKVKKIKSFLLEEDSATEEELKEKMLKNGENEKIPFDIDVIENAIALGQDIHKKEAQFLIEIYEKSNSILNEINTNSVKIQKYKKAAKNIKAKLEFIKAQKEYLIQFLDNERLSVSLGKREHKKMMKEACQDLEQDLEQINNLYELLLKETEGKATQKMYKELYNAEYLEDLKQKEIEFDTKVSELNLVGKIVNPIYWRIDGIKKIYAVFDKIVTEEYQRDLSKFKKEEEELVEKEVTDEDNIIYEEEIDDKEGYEEDEYWDDEGEEDWNDEEKTDEEEYDDVEEDEWNDEEDFDEDWDDWEDEDGYEKDDWDNEHEEEDSLLKKRKEKIKKEPTSKKEKKTKNAKKGGIFGKFSNKK